MKRYSSKVLRRKNLIETVVIDGVLTLLAVLFILPLIWMLSLSLKSPQQLAQFPPKLLSWPVTVRSYSEALTGGNFFLYLKNSAFVTLLTTLGTVASSSIVAFGFACMKSRLKSIWFTLMISTMMIPSTITLIPMYSMYAKLGFVDTYVPLILPFYFGASAYSIFLLRQFFLAMPGELREAAYLDGCSKMGVFVRIYLPNAKPALMVTTMFSFVNTWNDFFNPMIYLSSPTKFTIPIGLQAFKKMYGGATDLGPLMAMSLLCVLPVLILYLTCQRHFVEGIALSGIKG